MILKFMTKEGMWRMIDNITQINYHYLENTKGVKINLFCNNKDTLIEEMDIETDQSVYVLNNEGRTIERI